MNKQYMINQVCQYVLDQDHEREDLESRLCDEGVSLMRDHYTIKQVRETLYTQRTDSIWYLAIYLADGAKEANKAYRGLIAEVVDYLRKREPTLKKAIT